MIRRWELRLIDTDTLGEKRHARYIRRSAAVAARTKGNAELDEQKLVIQFEDGTQHRHDIHGGHVRFAIVDRKAVAASAAARRLVTV